MKNLIIVLLLIAFLPLLSVEVFSEGFEGGIIPTEWTQEYVSGDVNWLVNDGGMNDHPPAANTGNFNAWFFDAATDGNTTRLITPDIALTTHSKLSFAYTMDDWVNYQDYLTVYYRTSAGEEWVMLQEFTEPVMEWEEITLDLPEPSETYSICFEAEANWGYGVCIDDVVVEDCVINILVWDNDNSSDYQDPNTGSNLNCENSITMSLDALGLDYELKNFLPTRLDEYDLIMIELGLYCVG